MDHTGANSLFTTKNVNGYLSVLNTNTRKAVNKGILFIYAYKDLYNLMNVCNFLKQCTPENNN